jgi:7,8-dihydropterin-6-yl-methyl-4-(beta-D-ribofuranosyl)aminobenzene 5'-phosphate synthase
MAAEGLKQEGTDKVEPGSIRLQVVFNNVPCERGLETSWGFACLVERPDTTLLFDTGDNGDILLSNMERLGRDPEAVRAVVLSHFHWDHTGGLEAFLERNPDVTVYMPASFPDKFQSAVAGLGATVVTVSGPQQLMDRIYSTGEMGAAIREQSLVLDTRDGLVVITGCAHPGVVDIAERAKTEFKKDLYLVMGGFHRGGRPPGEIREVIRSLRDLGVRKTAPSHCTGDLAIGMFREAWGEDFVEGGLGACITPAFPSVVPAG